jgi:TPP-dependent indolepyruvate ferredoxin oxidoreductase alpha subunit
MIAGASLPFTLMIDHARCAQCHPCMAADSCRGKAIRVIDPEDGPFVDMARCRGCLDCVPLCPFDAVIKQKPSSHPE